MKIGEKYSCQPKKRKSLAAFEFDRNAYLQRINCLGETTPTLSALKAFGFGVSPLLGRVHITGTPSGRGHQIALVTIAGEQRIADVGFGGGTPHTPILLEMDRPTSHARQTVRLAVSDPWGTMLQALIDKEWMDFYDFDSGHMCHADSDKSSDELLQEILSHDS